MSIRRAPRPQSNFYHLDKSISEDERLSWGARGLLIFLLGKPDHWEVSTTHLVKQTAGSAKPSKRDAVRGLLAELVSAGYIKREPVRNEAGVFQGMAYMVSEVSEPPEPAPENPGPGEPGTDDPGPDKPATDKPAPVDPPQASIEGVESIDGSGSTDSQQKDDAPDSVPDADDEVPDVDPADAAFETFWQAGMRKANRKAARKAFESAAKASDKPVAEFARFLADDIARRIAAEQLGFDRMHPTTYLNGDRWDDDLPAPPAQTNAKPGRAGFAQPKPAGSYRPADNDMPQWATEGS